MASVARFEVFLFSPLFHAITRRFTKLTRCIPKTSANLHSLPLSYKMEQMIRACHPADDEKPLDKGRIGGDKMYAKTAAKKN
jgi:hypothetical protein